MRDSLKLAAAYPFVAAVGGACSAGLGAATGAVGAKILHDAGHSSYSVLAATRNGAAGAAVLGPLQALILPRETAKHAMVQLGVGAALTAAEGALGAV